MLVKRSYSFKKKILEFVKKQLQKNFSVAQHSAPSLAFLYIAEVIYK